MWNELYHHGIRGQHWGVRRYQNEDGSLTKAGMGRAKKDYDRDSVRAYKTNKRLNKKTNKLAEKAYKKSLVAKGWEGPVDIHADIPVNTKGSKVHVDIGTHKNLSQKKAMKLEAKAEEFYKRSEDMQKQIDSLDRDMVDRGGAIIRNRHWTDGLVVSAIAGGAVGAGVYTAIRSKSLIQNQHDLKVTKQIRNNRIRGTT